MYLYDGVGGDMSVERARILSDSVCQDIASSGFTANDDKSIWEPTLKLVSWDPFKFQILANV